MKLFLASNSPRRKEILKAAGFDFTVKVSGYDERGKGNPYYLVKKFAVKKAESVFNALLPNEKQNSVVLGADTVVVLDGNILGKPQNKKAAVEMLKSLSGKTHTVLTGYAVITGKKQIKGVVKSKVTFNELTDKIIDDYVATGSPLDKAGAYGIQDDFPLVKGYNGSLNNVIGLPIERLKPILDKALKD